MVSNTPNEAFSFNVVTKNLGSMQDWKKNVSKTDKKNIAEDAVKGKYQFTDQNKEKLNANVNVKNLAEKIVDITMHNNFDKVEYQIKKNIKNSDGYKNNASITRQAIIEQLTSKDGVEKIVSIFRDSEKQSTPLKLKDLGFDKIELNNMSINIGEIDIGSNTITDTINDIILEKKYQEIQAIAAPKLAESASVFMFQEFTEETGLDPNEVMTIRPEAKAISEKGKFEFHYLVKEDENNKHKKMDCVIAIDANEFQNIENKSFPAAQTVDVACVTAERGRKKFMFISAHVTGFDKKATEENLTQQAAGGDKEMEIINQKVKEFRKANPGGIVVFGGDLNTYRELHAERHNHLEKAGLTVKGSGKETNIHEKQGGAELDYLAVSTKKNSLFKRTIAKFTIDKNATPDQFDMQQTSDHKEVRGVITLSTPKTQKLFNSFRSFMSSLSSFISGKPKGTTEAPSSLLQHKVTFNNDVHVPVPKQIPQTASTASTDVKGPATTTASSIPLTNTTTRSIPEPAKEKTDILLKRLAELKRSGNRLESEANKPANQQASGTQSMRPLPKPTTKDAGKTGTIKTKTQAKVQATTQKKPIAASEQTKINASEIPRISFYNMDSPPQRRSHVDSTIQHAVEYILNEQDKPTAVIMGIANMITEQAKTAKSKDVEVRLLNSKYLIGLCDELVSNPVWLKDCSTDDKNEIKGIVNLILKMHQDDPTLNYSKLTNDEREIYDDLVNLKNNINNKL